MLNIFLVWSSEKLIVLKKQAGITDISAKNLNCTFHPNTYSVHHTFLDCMDEWYAFRFWSVWLVSPINLLILLLIHFYCFLFRYRPLHFFYLKEKSMHVWINSNHIIMYSSWNYQILQLINVIFTRNFILFLFFKIILHFLEDRFSTTGTYGVCF